MGEPRADHLIGRVEIDRRGLREPAAPAGSFNDQPDLAGNPSLIRDRDEDEPVPVGEVVSAADMGEQVNSHTPWILLGRTDDFPNAVADAEYAARE